MTRILAPSNVYVLPQHLHQGPRVPTEAIKAQQQSEQSSIPNPLPPPYTYSRSTTSSPEAGDVVGVTLYYDVYSPCLILLGLSVAGRKVSYLPLSLTVSNMML